MNPSHDRPNGGDDYNQNWNHQQYQNPAPRHNANPARPVRVRDPSILTSALPQLAIADAVSAADVQQPVKKNDLLLPDPIAFINQEHNCAPRFMRSSLYTLLTDPNKNAAIPFNLVISPFARAEQGESEPPIVRADETAHVKCKKCKSPLMKFVKKAIFKCLACSTETKVAIKDSKQLGTSEFDLSTSSDAMRHLFRDGVPPKVPAFIFIIDVSYNSVRSGQVGLICREMKNILKSLPVERGVTPKVGFITYSDQVHFYNIDTWSRLRMHIVVDDVTYAPGPFVGHVGQSQLVIDELMSKIPAMFFNGGSTGTILAAAIRAGMELLKVAACAGKLLVFTSPVPAEKFLNRRLKLSGTDQEYQILRPESQLYDIRGRECAEAGCSVDLFVTNNSFTDLATIGQVARMSGGQVNKYTDLVADGWRFIEDVKRSLSSTIAFDAVIDVRVQEGITTGLIFGHGLAFSNNLDKNSARIQLGAVDSNKSITVQLKQQSELGIDSVHIQASILYTSVAGQRRMRVFNLSLNTCTSFADMYPNCDLETVMNFLLKQSVARILNKTPDEIHDGLHKKAGLMFNGWARNSQRMKLVPFYMNCLLNCPILKGGLSLDDRCLDMYAVATMSVAETNVYLFPTLVPLAAVHKMKPPHIVPPRIRCSRRRLGNCIYVLENGIDMFMWVGQNATDEWKRDGDFCVRAEKSGGQLVAEPGQMESFRSQKMRSVIAKMRSSRGRHMRLIVVAEGSELDSGFGNFLVEDGGVAKDLQGQGRRRMSYREFYRILQNPKLS